MGCQSLERRVVGVALKAQGLMRTIFQGVFMLTTDPAKMASTYFSIFAGAKPYILLMSAVESENGISSWYLKAWQDLGYEVPGLTGCHGLQEHIDICLHGARRFDSSTSDDHMSSQSCVKFRVPGIKNISSKSGVRIGAHTATLT